MPKNPTESRPFSFRPQDFGAPEPIPKSAVTDKRESDEEEKAHSYWESETSPSLNAERASQGSSTEGQVESSEEVAPKKDQTILMAVPPPAQENKGQ